MTIPKHCVRVPTGNRKVKVRMPTGVRSYKVNVQSCAPCLSPNLITDPFDFTYWINSGTVSITPDNLNCPQGNVQNADFLNFPTSGASLTHPVVSGLAAFATVNFSFWIYHTFPGRLLTIDNVALPGSGRWTFNTGVIPSNQWVLLEEGVPGVTVVTPFLTDGDGNLQFALSVQTSNVVYHAWCMRAWI